MSAKTVDEGGFGTGGDKLFVVSISYLGHIITEADVAMDLAKVQAICG
jgi:hypothetical protein